MSHIGGSRTAGHTSRDIFGVQPSTQTALTRGQPTTSTDALTARLLEIQDLAARGDPAFQQGSGFFGTRVGGAVETALASLTGDGDASDIASVIAEALRTSSAQQASTDSAGLALQRELGLGQLAVSQGQLGLAQRTQAFTEQDIQTQRLLEAAGLATGPTGAIQLAFLARGQGAPQAEVASIFQNLPFVQALLAGETLPSFGLPGQLGGEFNRVSSVGNVIEGQNLGVTIPATTGVSRTQFENLTPTEQAFLGALGQSETGTPSNEFLEQIMRTFIPENTGTGSGVSIGF